MNLLSKLRLIGLHIRGYRLSFYSHIQGNVSIIAYGHKPSALAIGSNTTLRSFSEIRVGREARAIIGSNVLIDSNVRIVVANNAILEIADGVRIGKGTVINAGDNCSIGAKTLISGYCYLQCSSHNISAGIPIKEQGHTHSPIEIGSDCMIGAFSFVERGTVMEDGAVCGSHSYIKGSVAEDRIMIGRPVTEIGRRI